MPEPRGPAALADGSSRPLKTPHRTTADIEADVCRLRTDRKLGPARIGPILGLPASTVHRILTRRGLHRLAWLDRPTGTVIRRYERDQPGELIHIDVKKPGRIPDGGGHKILGRAAGSPNKDRRNGIGYAYLHTALDAHTRLTYTEDLPDETAPTCAGCLTRATAWFATRDITVERVLTDNVWAYTRTPGARPAMTWASACLSMFVRCSYHRGLRTGKPGARW
ncbi:DDE-type integrase/transposase/recombinase [Streptomyces sp. NPDC093099]|uniref:DDE-type integrase/transposase/recombinase n=1 Tax=Streptomyces sp. NPDC093099 TaxID=3366028 RepID=UPI003829ECCF